MAAAFLPNGRQVVTAGGHDPVGAGDRPDGEVRLWDVETGEEIRRFKGHDHEIKSLAVSADGKRMLTAGQDNRMILWDVDKGTEIRRTEAPSEFGPWVSIARHGCRA